MPKLTTKALAAWRAARVQCNGGRCGLCKLPIKLPRADHDHATGAMRDAICNGCNAVLGKIENAYRRYGVQNLSAFLHGAATYLQLHTTDQHGLIHPTHKTDDEKRILRNTRARAKRAAGKEAA